MARNVIEHIFGIVKRCFHILLLLPEYSLGTQSQLPATLACLHNFILTHDPFKDDIYDNDDEGVAGPEPDHAPEENEAVEEMGALHLGHGDAGVMRNNIGQRMWDDYQSILQSRQTDSDDDDDLTDEFDTMYS